MTQGPGIGGEEVVGRLVVGVGTLEGALAGAPSRAPAVAAAGAAYGLQVLVVLDGDALVLWLQAA